MDVFAPADAANMEPLAESGELEGPPRIMARNVLSIAVPAGNPGRVQGLEDFARESLRIGLCAEEVPCGSLAGEALRRAGVTPRPDTREPNVRALLSKIALGELDAGIVYGTDVAAALTEVEGLAIPGAHTVSAEYMVAVLADAPNAAAARAFVAFVLSLEGQAILDRNGFTPA